ncbi:MAG: hypothetical protein CM15mP22_0670 [Gammaproteobacteria bacterium]|nr:MAG: hypothetical protein CM15mP22_0670 [Gammaproteobacteria bacterium]
MEINITMVDQLLLIKFELAAQKLSGIMIWELGQDSFTEYSLLETIHKTYTDLGVKTTELCGN